MMMADTEEDQLITDEKDSSFDQNSAIECTDEILSPVADENLSVVIMDELESAENVGLDDEFGDFQVLDECGEEEAEEAPDLQEQPSKNADNSKSASSTSKDKPSPNATSKQQVKEKSSGKSDTTSSPTKKSSTARRSKSPTEYRSRKRDDSRKRSSRSGRSRSRSRQRRSSSRSRNDRRRTRSRSPRRTSRRKTPEKKPAGSSNAAKKDDVKKKETEKSRNDAKGDGQTKNDTARRTAENIGSGQDRKTTNQKKDDGKAAKPGSCDNATKSTTPAAGHPKDGLLTSPLETTENAGASAKEAQNEIGVESSEKPAVTSNGPSLGSVEPEAMATEPGEKQGAQLAFDNTASLAVENTPVEPPTSILSSKLRMASNTYDGDFLEIAVPEGACLEDSLTSLSNTVQTAIIGATGPKFGVSTADTPERGSQSQPRLTPTGGTGDTEGKTTESKPSQSKKSHSNDNVPKSKDTSEASQSSRNLKTASKKQDPASVNRPSEKLSQHGRQSEKTWSKPKPSSDEKDTKKESTSPKKTPAMVKKAEKEPTRKVATTQPKTERIVKVEPTLAVPGSNAQEGEDLLFSKSPVLPRRTEPVPGVKAYVDSIRNLEFDTKVYCCFYCVACPLLLPTTPRYEDHLVTSDHKKNVVRWRICQDLLGEELKPHANRQLDVENFAETIVGADQIIEVCDSNGTPCNFVCIMCSTFHSDLDTLLSHLTSFLHIENYMEKQSSEVFSPPDVSVSEFELATIAKRQNDPDHVAKVFAAARGQMMRHGRGCMRSYVGDKYHDMNCSLVTEMEEIEETVMMSLMEQLFAGDGSHKTKWERIAINKSVGNRTYEKQPKETQEKIVGLQAIMEIWFPNRRMPPVYYCAVCNYMVTDIIAHCITNKHWIEYFDKCYKRILESLILEADDANSMKESLVTAVKFVLNAERSSGRIQSVVQLLADPGVIFCAVNAQIAKQIVAETGFKVAIPKPETPKKPATTKPKPPIGGPSTKAKPTAPPVVKDSEKTTNVKRPTTSKQAATAVLKRTVGRLDRGKTGNVAQNSRPAASKAPARGTIAKVGATRSLRPMDKRRPVATVSADSTRDTNRREIHEVKRRVVRLSPPAGTKRRRSDSRSPKGSRRRGSSGERREAARPVQSTPQRSGPRNALSRPLPGHHPPSKVSKGPILRPAHVPSAHYHRKKSSPELRGRPRTPSPPRPHATDHHRPQHQESFGHVSKTRGRGEVNSDDLRRLTEVLRSYIGLDYGRDLTAEDLDGVRAALPPGTLDDLLELLRRAPSMSFHNFFAERRAVNTGSIGGVNEASWAMMGNRNEEERPHRRSSFTGHSYESHGRRRSNKNDGPYSQHEAHRQYGGRRDHTSDGNPPLNMRRGIDDRSHNFQLRTPAGPPFGGGVPETVPVFDVVQTYENPNSSGSMIGSGVVYAQPLSSSFSDPTFMPQQPPSAIMGTVFGRMQSQDPSNVAYGVPIQGADNSVFMPMPAQAGNTPGEFWYMPPPQPHNRRGNSQEGPRKW